MTNEEITRLRIRAVDSLKAQGVRMPMPEQIIKEMNRLKAAPVDTEEYARKMFNDLFSQHMGTK